MPRARAKKHIPERLEKCHERWFESPMLNKGKWREICKIDAPIFLEVGCGKGKFACEMAERHSDVLYIAMERDTSIILSAIEKAHEREIKNLFFINGDVQLIDNYFEENEVDRMFINFCDPWTRRKKPKRRLTYREFLLKYKTILKEGSKICFKTDNDDLFDFSLIEFEEMDFLLSEVTRDLHNSEYDSKNIRTEFEQKFADQGINIKRLVATVKKSD